MHLRLSFLLIASVGLAGGVFPDHCQAQLCPARTSSPDVVPILEMESFERDYPLRPDFLPPETLVPFSSHWQPLTSELEKAITPKMLQAISRWAKDKMEGVTLPPEWLKGLPMKAIGLSSDKRQVLFSHPVNQGVPLPSHHNAVHRRVMVGVVFEPECQQIPKVFVTIRGWKEE